MFWRVPIPAITALPTSVGLTPGIPYRYLRELLSLYARPYALTDSILQEARDLAKKQLFGHAEQNVQYAKGVVAELGGLGHHVRVLYADRKEIVQAVCAIALKDELDRLKKVKQTLDRMGWSGWLVLERSRDAKEPNNVKKNFGSNAAYMKSIFQ